LIAWTGSDGSGSPLPDGEFTNQELTVEEIQATAR
jgi:hypothetical protein